MEIVLWQCGILGEVVKNVVMVAYIAIFYDIIILGENMSVDEKIFEFLKKQKSVKNASLSGVKITKGQNKDGISLLYVRTDIFEKQLGLGINYSNNSTYYAFDMDGNYVGCVKVSVSNIISPTQVEMEYWANEEYKNKGNMTTLARDVISEIFENKVFDNLKVRDGISTSSIESIMLDINPDNYASFAVARKLGFNENGILNIIDYYKQLESQSSKKI